ncbi:MAG: excisionase family DNA-binding protein [Proteobacteria bacterium]|nr:excisionase family DNA-binding protein [Pseudomonadota bacterium]
MSTEPWVSVGDVAKHLSIAKNSIDRRIEHRSLPAHEVGRFWEFKLSEVDEWVRAGGVGAEGPKPAGEEGHG